MAINNIDVNMQDINFHYINGLDNENDINSFYHVYNKNRNDILELMTANNLTKYDELNNIDLFKNENVKGIINNYFSFSSFSYDEQQQKDFINTYINNINKKELPRQRYCIYNLDNTKLKILNNQTDTNGNIKMYLKMLSKNLNDTNFNHKIIDYNNLDNINFIDNNIDSVDISSYLNNNLNYDYGIENLQVDNNIKNIIYLTQNLFQGTISNANLIINNTKKPAEQLTELSSSKIIVIDSVNDNTDTENFGLLVNGNTDTNNFGLITFVTMLYYKINIDSGNVIKIPLGYFLQPIKTLVDLTTCYSNNGRFLFVPINEHTLYNLSKNNSSKKFETKKSIMNEQIIKNTWNKLFNISCNLNVFPCLGKDGLKTSRLYKTLHGIGSLKFDEYNCKLGSKELDKDICTFNGLIKFNNIFKSDVEANISAEISCLRHNQDYNFIINNIVKFLNDHDVIKNIPMNIFLTVDKNVLINILSHIINNTQNLYGNLDFLDIIKIYKKHNNQIQINYYKAETDDYTLNSISESLKDQTREGLKSLKNYHSIFFIVNIPKTPETTQTDITDEPLYTEQIVKLNRITSNNDNNKLTLMKLLSKNNHSANIFVSSFSAISMYTMTQIAYSYNNYNTINKPNILKTNLILLEKLIKVINAFYNIKLILNDNTNEIFGQFQPQIFVNGYKQQINDSKLIATDLNKIEFTKKNIDYVMNILIYKILNDVIKKYRINYSDITLDQLKQETNNEFEHVQLPPTLAQQFAVTRANIAQKALNITQKAKLKLHQIGNLTKRAGVAVSTGITKGIEHIKKTKISLADPSVFPPFDSRERRGTKKISIVSPSEPPPPAPAPAPAPPPAPEPAPAPVLSI